MASLQEVQGHPLVPRQNPQWFSPEGAFTTSFPRSSGNAQRNLGLPQWEMGGH